MEIMLKYIKVNTDNSPRNNNGHLFYSFSVQWNIQLWMFVLAASELCVFLNLLSMIWNSSEWILIEGCNIAKKVIIKS